MYHSFFFFFQHKLQLVSFLTSTCTKTYINYRWPQCVEEGAYLHRLPIQTVLWLEVLFELPHTESPLSGGAVCAYLCGLPIQTVLWVKVMFDQISLLLPLLDCRFQGLGRLLQGACCTHQVIGRLSQPLAGLFQLSLCGLKQVVNLKILT